MSRSTSATLRLARLLPASKMGSVICGANLQAVVLPPKSPFNSLLPSPAEETRVMRGKNAARAAPMLAFAP